MMKLRMETSTEAEVVIRSCVVSSCGTDFWANARPYCAPPPINNKMIAIRLNTDLRMMEPL